MNVKVVFFITSGRQGWSETYYLNAGDLNSAFATSLILASKRSLLMASPVVIDYVRVSDNNNNRNSRLVGVGTGTPYPMPAGGYTSQADRPETAGLVACFDTANNVQRPLWIRGNPDNAYDAAAPGNPDQALWQTRLSSFLGELVSSHYQILERTRLGEGGIERPVLAVAPDWTLNETALTTDTAIPGLKGGDLLILYGMRGFSPTPGVVKVKNVQSAGLVINVHWVPNKPTPFSGGATIVVYNSSYHDITATAFVRFANRQTGRPFGVPRGRRRAIAR